MVDLHFAQKVETLGCDALIAVNNEAGGHRGAMGAQSLIELLDANTSLPVISAGGVSDSKDFNKMIAWGAAGVSVGSPFIASEEASVSEAYKEGLCKLWCRRYCRNTSEYPEHLVRLSILHM